jgi:hypothetical protein
MIGDGAMFWLSKPLQVDLISLTTAVEMPFFSHQI